MINKHSYAKYSKLTPLERFKRSLFFLPAPFLLLLLPEDAEYRGLTRNPGIILCTLLSLYVTVSEYRSFKDYKIKNPTKTQQRPKILPKKIKEPKITYKNLSEIEANDIFISQSETDSKNP